MSGATRSRAQDRGPKDQGQGDSPKPSPPTPDPSQGQEGPKGTDEDKEHQADIEALNEEESTEAAASSERPEPRPIDRSELGLILRDGQRLALHVRSKVHLPELQTWAQRTQQFMNDYGL